MLHKDPTFLSYFPSKYPKNKGPPRDYFMNILNTLYPDFLQECMNHANEQRMAAFGKGQEHESIAISKFWEEELKRMPYLTRKCRPDFHPNLFLLLMQRRTARPWLC